MHLRPHPSGLGCCLFYGSGSVVVDSLFIVAPIVGVLCLAPALLYLTLCPLLFCNHLASWDPVALGSW